MIYNYPFFGFPNYLNHNQSVSNQYLSNYSRYQNRTIKPNNNSHYEVSYNDRRVSNNFRTNNNTALKSNVINTEKKREKQDKQNSFFDLFGIHLYFDDILLICVILFLYNEKIDDYYLLLALILLLLG